MEHIKKCLKLYALISCITASFLGQSSHAMDGEKENPGLMVSSLRSLYDLTSAVADVMDQLHGVDLYVSPSTSPMQEGESSFFPNQPDEVSMMVFVHLYKDKDDIGNLCAVALTCTHGYQLMVDSYFGRLLKPALKTEYFKHLPQEYIDVLLEGREDVGLKLGYILLQQVFAYQVDETKRLSEMLYSKPTPSLPERDSILVNNVSQEAKDKWLDKLSTLMKWNLGLYEPEEEENVKKTINSALKRYLFQEEVLDSINSEIIEQCLNFIGIQQGLNFAQIRLQCSLTRLPSKGIEFIDKWLLGRNHLIDGVVLDLSYNHLRWIPDVLFSLKKIRILNLYNNLLCYLPSKVECFQDHLTTLNLGNHESFFPLFTNHHSRRTLGNKFGKVPQAIFKLKKLISLDLGSVQLDEFPENKIFEALPELEYVDVAHNNLLTIPQDRSNWGIFCVVDYGNPGSLPPPIYQRMGDYLYDVWARHPNMQCLVRNFFRHPFG